MLNFHIYEVVIKENELSICTSQHIIKSLNIVYLKETSIVINIQCVIVEIARIAT